MPVGGLSRLHRLERVPWLTEGLSNFDALLVP